MFCNAICVERSAEMKMIVALLAVLKAAAPTCRSILCFDGSGWHLKEIGSRAQDEPGTDDSHDSEKESAH